MGQKLSKSFPFVRGLEQRAASKMLPDGTLAVLHNARIDQAGKLVRRLGWEAGPQLDTTGVAPDGQIRALAPLDGKAVALTTRAAYQLGPSETAWRHMSPAVTVPPVIASPVETFAIPVAESVQSEPLYPATAAECVCTAVAVSGISGWYVLVAWRTGSAGELLWLGYMDIALYRMWIDDFGERHWEHLWTRSPHVGVPTGQLKAFTMGDTLAIAWIQQNAGPAYSLNAMTVTPRSSLTSYTSYTIHELAAAPGPWDIDWGVASSSGVYAVYYGGDVRVGILTASFTEAAYATIECVAGRLAASWDVSYPAVVVWDSVVETLTQYRYNLTAVLQEATSLEADCPDCDSIGVTQAWEGSAGQWRTWWTRPVSAGAPTNISHTTLRSQKWARSTGAKVGDATLACCPGPMISKPELWGEHWDATETAAWFYSTHEDTADRSLILCRIDPTTAQATPLAIASSGQTALYSTYTTPNQWTSFASLDGTPTQYFFGGCETCRGLATDAYPALGPVIHVLSVDSMVPPAVTAIGQTLRVPEGVSVAYGAGGRLETQPLQSPGRIYAGADAAGVLDAGTYQYAAVYRMALPDGTEVLSAPSFTSVVVAADDTLVQVFVRIPRATLHSQAEWSRSLWIDIYRSLKNGSILQYTGSAGCDPADSGNQYESFNDATTDAVLAGRANLYTTGGVFPAAVLPSLRVLTTHRDRLFGAHGRNLYYSTQRVAGSAPYFPAGGFLPLHDTITALATTEAGLLIFGRTWTYLLPGDGPGPNLQPQWAPPQPVSQEVGCVGQHTVHHSVILGVTWQSDRGIEQFAGGQIQLFSGAVHKHIASYPIVRAVVEVPEHHQVRWLLSKKGTGPTDGLWICWDTMHQQWSTETVAVGGYCCTAAAVPGVTANTTSRYYAARSTGEAWFFRKQNTSYYDYDPTTPVWPTIEIRTGTVRPNGLGGYGRLRRIRILGEPPPSLSDPGEIVQIYVNNQEDAGEAFASDDHTITIPAPTSGPTQVVLEIAPAAQLCSEFSLAIYSGAPAAGTALSGCAWTGFAFDWEEASRRGRGVPAMRG